MRKLAFIVLILIPYITLVCLSCSRNKLPTISTTEISKITSNSALCGGTVSNDGGFTIIDRGVCFSTEPMPSIKDLKTSNGAGVGGFSSKLIDLQENTRYYVRAYAINDKGIRYGMTVSFVTERGSNLYLLYKQLKQDNYDVPDDFEVFEYNLKNSLVKSKAIFETLLKDNYAIPDDFETFLRTFDLKKMEPIDYGLPQSNKLSPGDSKK